MKVIIEKSKAVKEPNIGTEGKGGEGKRLGNREGRRAVFYLTLTLSCLS